MKNFPNPAKTRNCPKEKEKVQDKPLEQTAKLQQELLHAIQEQVEAQKQAEYVRQQEEIAQEQERIAQELREQQKQIEQTLAATGKLSSDSIVVNAEGLDERFPGFQKTNLSLEERSLLAKLYLNEEQILAIALRSQKVKNHEQELREKYPKLTTEQKLKLLNLGLQALNFKTSESKANLVKLRQQILTERQNFDLSPAEKEQTLKFFITQLALSDEQQDKLEDMGIKRVKLNPEEKENIGQPKPKLTNQNESILKTLAPLAKEYKYSPSLLKSIQTLNLKYDTLSFFTQQQIIPDPNLEFGKPKDPYKLLKQQVIEKEQKKLFKEQQAKEKAEALRRSQIVRESLLPSLIKFAQDNFAEDNLLFTQGFKATKNYDYFEILAFAFGLILKNGKNEALITRWLGILNEGNADTLCEQFTEAENTWEQYLTYQAEKLQTQLEANRQEFAEREAITSAEQNKKVKLSELIPSLAEYIDKKFQESGGRTFAPHPESTGTSSTTTSQKPEQPANTGSRYDDLLANLSQEEKERQQKKKNREEARRKLDDLEFNLRP
ncbi:1210_t:CDS:2, partial [Funneliformis geosporum]